jgi:energy-converting hydrogenase Eha subunit E
MTARRRVLACQSAYYVLTGLWPLVHLGSFEAVTGPKTDDWLVRMVGLLATAIGGSIGVAVAREHTRAPEVVVLAAAAAFAFGAIDLWYGLTGRISPVYLADAAVEIGLLAALALTRE